jgi:hypothetical protein
MPRPKNNRKFWSESGKTFQDLDTEGFVRAIAAALKAEFGATPSALKIAGEDPYRERARGGRRLCRQERPARRAAQRVPQPAHAGFWPEPRSVRADDADRRGARRDAERTRSAHRARSIDPVAPPAGARSRRDGRNRPRRQGRARRAVWLTEKGALSPKAGSPNGSARMANSQAPRPRGRPAAPGGAWRCRRSRRDKRAGQPKAASAAFGWFRRSRDWFSWRDASRRNPGRRSRAAS